MSVAVHKMVATIPVSSELLADSAGVREHIDAILALALGLRLNIRHAVPITLIARTTSCAIRWRMGAGFDRAIITPDERAAVWTPS